MPYAKNYITTDHAFIKEWVERRGGQTVIIRTPVSSKEGSLRIIFADEPQSQDEQIEEICWSKFFEIFDKKGLLFVYQEMNKNGEISHFCRFARL